MAASHGSEFLEVDVESQTNSFGRASNAENVERDEEELIWAAIEKLPSLRRPNSILLRRTASEAGDGNEQTETLDVRKLTKGDRQLLVKNALATTEQDNYRLLSRIKERLDRVGIEMPKVEVRYENLNVTASVQVGSRSLPTLINYMRDIVEYLFTKLRIYRPNRYSLAILKNVSGVIRPGRMTLLLGPPSSGKSTLLRVLAGKLDRELKKSGNITYNGHKLDEFCVERTAAYISQNDNHIAEMTVRETFDFAARCQGANTSFAEYVTQLQKLEKERNIHPNHEIDAYMKAMSVPGAKHSVSTDYYMKVLGLDVCSDTVVGSDMLRGVSGGQKKRVTTGEMVVGPRKTLYMDEISTGLDSSTTYQIVKCLKNFVHFMDGTILMALLQPAPETFDLFDDIVLLSEGYLVYHGPREEVVEFFESLGFRLPPRKGVADFLQEVTSRKDQAQYWADPYKPYEFLSVKQIAEAFDNSKYNHSLRSTLSVPYDKSKSHPSALPKKKYAISRMELFKACFSRELLLISRNRFLYIFRTCQVATVATVACTMFIRLSPKDVASGDLYLSCLFYGLVHMLFNGFSELSLLIFRLPVFYKQRDNFFHPGWAWSLASWILRVPYSLVEALVWSSIVYYSVGLAPSFGRFCRFAFALFSIHQMGLGLFRTMASVSRDIIIANTFGSASLLIVLLLGGFLVPKNKIKPWWVWAFWVSPLSYGQRAFSVNEFTADRWREQPFGNNSNLGDEILKSHGIPLTDAWYWLGVGALILFALFFNMVVTWALTFLNPIRHPQTISPSEVEENDTGGRNYSETNSSFSGNEGRKGMILPFQPLTMTFHNVNYFVDTPKEMMSQGVTEKKLQLLSNVSGVFSPGVLTALVGSSGAGKTTLMDVLAGRKTGGYIEGDIRISGHRKQQSTFARVSGYVEQNDIHSPQVTVFESLVFSSFLRLPNEVKKEQKEEFVEEVLRLVELDSIRDALVGMPGSSGLSTEQRKRLTIAVELVANPAIIFMDEPTSGLDARAAAIVMRTVRNTVDTGRTVVCTIHQPSIEIFEAFDELLLMKRGGRVIYGGKLGEKSNTMIDYFQRLPGIPPVADGYNPATWMLEISTPAAEERIGRDFAVIYQNSQQYREVEASIEQLSVPPIGSEPLRFSSTYSQNTISQFRTCFWKQVLVYWRSPQYTAVRLLFTAVSALLIGSIYWDVGSKRDTTTNLMLVMGALYSAALFLGVNNSSSVQPVVSIERTVFYRERAAGMYSPLPYAAALGLVELPYIAAQTVIYSIITYFMISFERTAAKFFLFVMFMFLTFSYFTFYGMMIVGLTPNLQVSAVASSACYSLWNLISGFLVPKPSIPPWWIWFYYICPISWTLRGIISSQLGDVETTVIGPGFEGTVKDYLEVRLGYTPGMTGPSAVILLAFSGAFFAAFATSLKVLNFQKR